MKHHLSPWRLALLLVLACAIFRILSNLHPGLLSGFTPCVALAFVGAIYLSHRWSWLVGVAAILVSEAAFLKWNVLSDAPVISSFLLVSLGFYAAMGGLGVLLARRKSLGLLFAAPILGSILFYVIANTFAWWSGSHSGVLPAYPPGWAGWIQANTTGLPGYLPAWTFLRNGVAGDLVFTTLFIAIFEPSLLTRFSGKPAPKTRVVRAS
jgi:hypothetical protein